MLILSTFSINAWVKMSEGGERGDIAIVINFFCAFESHIKDDYHHFTLLRTPVLSKTEFWFKLELYVVNRNS